MNALRRHLPLFVLTSPALCVLAVLALYPIAQVLIDSFFQVDYAAHSRQFVGLTNYRTLLDDRVFAGSVFNTLHFSIVASLAEVGLGLGLALLFRRTFAGKRIALPLLILPMMLSTLVCSSIWRGWFNYSGFLNSLLASVNCAPVEWLSNPHMAMWSLILVDVWQWTPMAFLIILAGLQAIPEEILEAAHVDGASAWQRFWQITLPLISRQLMLALLLRSIDTFKLFDKVYALTGGGPGNATKTLSTYIYEQGFQFFNVGPASAASVFMLLIAGVLVALYVREVICKPAAQ